MKRSFVALALCLVILGAWAGDDESYVHIAEHHLRTALPGRPEGVLVPTFWIRRRPVSNEDFLAFVRSHPEWQRGQVPALMADADYLSHWQSATAFQSPVRAAQPVTRVSWFAAQAYCEAEGGRLPNWNEWELVAAADKTREDARSDPAWRQQILDWYSRPDGPLADVGQGPANIYGVQDIHGLVWEWVLDFNSLVVGSDASGELQKICGGSALSLEQKENYAVLMHVAMLSGLHGADTGHSLGFRCARDDAAGRP